MGDDIRNDILFEHNLFRSQLAHGNIEFFSSGSNIYSLVFWLIFYTTFHDYLNYFIWSLIEIPFTDIYGFVERIKSYMIFVQIPLVAFAG